MTDVSHLKTLGEGKTTYRFDEPWPDLLETFERPGFDPMVITIETSEFTSLCPKTGQPDWARIVIRYQPDELCVESKSLKLYLMSFRNHGEFHEACVQRILHHLVGVVKPKWMVVEGHFTARGGIPFLPVAVCGSPDPGLLALSQTMAPAGPRKL